MLINVAIGIPSAKIFTYSVPEGMVEDIAAGKRVLVPFGRRKVTGYITEKAVVSEVEGVKDIIGVLDEDPLFSEKDLDFYRWMSDYYMYPLGKSLKSVLPNGIDTKSDRWVSLSEEAINTEKKLSGIQCKIIEVLKVSSDGVSVKKLKKEINNEGIYKALNALESLGLVTVRDRLERPGARSKMKTFVKIKDGFYDDTKLTEKQKNVADFLVARGETALSRLSEEFKGAPSVVESLEKKGAVSKFRKEVLRDRGETVSIGRTRLVTLNGAQEKSLECIVEAISSEKYVPFLLHGVTGSGKTEVYLRAMEEVLKTGGSAIYLVPEISLTPQLVSRAKDRFDKSLIAVFHSKVGMGMKYDEWRRVQKGDAKIVVGARSAVFAPVKDLRLIIVDEEHDDSYKQEDRLAYNARDLAIVRAKLNSAAVVLGSATPGIQTYFNVGEKNFKYLSLPKRVENRPLPEVEVVDMRNERGEGGNIPMLSRALEDAIRDTLNRGKQVLLFLNRRGFDTFLCCLDCGHVFKCANCSVAMTHHMSDGTLRCHYCGYSVKALPICPTCGGSRVRSYGVGTEKLKEKIELLFPEAVIERMDSDSTSEKGAYERILRSVHEGKIDVLVGTQMITKGHDFPNVTLIGVISADTSLNAPDFRAAEKTFQILTQVSGRGGRGDTPGNVIIQTLNPDHYAIRRAKEHDYTGFYGDEIPLRKELGYPPFGRMVNFRISGTNRDKTADFSVMLGNIARRFSESKNIKHKIDVMGPVEAPIARIKGRFRWQMILKGRESRALHVLTENILKAAGKTDLDIKVDVDPLNFM